MSKIVIQFKGNKAKTLYTDRIDLRKLGKLTVRRASHVEFNAPVQMWEVRFPESDEVQFSHSNRSTCIDWEIQHFQNNGFKN